MLPAVWPELIFVARPACAEAGCRSKSGVNVLLPEVYLQHARAHLRECSCRRMGLVVASSTVTGRRMPTGTPPQQALFLPARVGPCSARVSRESRPRGSHGNPSALKG